MLAKRRRKQSETPIVVPPYVPTPRIHMLPYTPMPVRTRPEDIVGSPEWIAENRRLSRLVK